MIKNRSNRLLLFVSVSLIAIIGLVIVSQIEKGDLVIFFTNNRTSFLNLFFKNVTKLPEPYFFSATIILLVFIKFRFAITMLLSSLVSLAVSGGLKEVFSAPRPLMYFRDLDQLHLIQPFVSGVDVHEINSFPSGHTMGGFVLFGLFFLFSNNRLLQVFALTGGILVGISRIYLSQHFLLDTIAGMIIGTIIAILIDYLIEKKLNKSNVSLLEKGLKDSFFKQQSITSK